MTDISERVQPSGRSKNLDRDGEILFDPGSYRDRTGRVLCLENRIFRLLDQAGGEHWKRLQGTRFFARSIDQGLMIPTKEAEDFPWERLPEGHRWKVALEHERIPFLSYPYGWSWSMLRDAALLHLEILLMGLEEEFLTKDGTAYNIQWRGTEPVFIDVGSLCRRKEGEPWAGYRQFCQTFLFPLMLTSHKGIPFQSWMRGSLDGIDVGEVVGMFGWGDLFKAGVMIDVWLHHQLQRGAQAKEGKEPSASKGPPLNQGMIRNNLLRLQKIVGRLSPPKQRSHWTGYAANNTYTSEDQRVKREFIEQVAGRKRWKMCWDLGCNTGEFSRRLAAHADLVVAMDSDIPSVEMLYQQLRADRVKNILPLKANLADPPPSQGWLGMERKGLTERGKPELTIALALIHHLVIGANLPMTEVIKWFASLGGELVIEFVGRRDPMVLALLKHKEDHYFDYDQELFEKLLKDEFQIVRQTDLNSGNRTLYHCLPLVPPCSD
ncbi:MAG: class I SAM-dependent methyltransferase [Planctomycetaceae bacterium]|nr:class I SAM-dependent methyltransferase [Planctomycetaceae bacterium]